MALNYLGPNIGRAQLADTLSSGMPGTVPAAIPGVTPPDAVGSVSPTGVAIPSRPVISEPGAPLPPSLANAISPAGPTGTPPPAPGGSELPNYTTETQSDGTVILYQINSDGTRLARKVLPALKPVEPLPGASGVPGQ